MRTVDIRCKLPGKIVVVNHLVLLSVGCDENWICDQVWNTKELLTAFLFIKQFKYVAYRYLMMWKWKFKHALATLEMKVSFYSLWESCEL